MHSQIFIYICLIYNDLASLSLPLGAKKNSVDVVVNIKVCIPRFLYIYAIFIMIWHHSVCPWGQHFSLLVLLSTPRYTFPDFYIYICNIYNLVSLSLPLGATFLPVDVVVNTKVCIPRYIYIYIYIYREREREREICHIYNLVSLNLPLGATFLPVDVVVNIKVCIPRFFIYIIMPYL